MCLHSPLYRTFYFYRDGSMLPEFGGGASVISFKVKLICATMAQ
jgi:hypothetical protein